MKYTETAFERDGKIIYRFDFGGGVAQECDSPVLAEGIRRMNRNEDERKRVEDEVRSIDAADTSMVKQKQCMTKDQGDDPDTLRHTRTLDMVEKSEFERSDLKPSISALTAQTSLPAKVENPETSLAARKPDDAPSTRVDLGAKIKSTSWRDLLETENYGTGLHFAQSGGEMTMLANLFFCQGGSKLKAAYKDPARRKEVIDEIMASQVASYAGISQMAGMMLGSIKDQAISGNFNSPNSAFKSALDVKMRADKMVLNVIESHHRVQNAVAGSVYVNKAEQVNLQYNGSDPKQTRREEISGQPRLRTPKRLKAKK